jgi:hypothetical protein
LSQSTLQEKDNNSEIIDKLNGYGYLEVSKAISTLKEANERRDAIMLKNMQASLDRDINKLKMD